MRNMMTRLHMSDAYGVKIELFKVSRVHWAVKIYQDEDARSFSAIEPAADYLEDVGVPGDEIDDALMDMAANNHTHASFEMTPSGIIKLKNTDNIKLDELLGSA